MSSAAPFGEINEAKANMDHIYDQTDPRAYFAELKRLEYAIPDTAKPIFEKLILHMQKGKDHTIRVLDLGCSYGVNAAILKHDISMQKLYDHWGEGRMENATSKEVASYDRQFFADLNESSGIEVIGLDQAKNAVAFGEEIGLLDEGIAANLENSPLSALETEKLASVDLVTSTGCIGYLTEKSFDCLLPAVTEGRSPWIANFVLRAFPFNQIEESLSQWGYVTEKLENRMYFQRRFESASEKEQMLGKLCDQGVDPTGLEDEGNLIAEFYLSRPEKDVADFPLEALFTA